MYIMNGAVVIYNCLVLYKLLRGSQPVVVCPARGIEKMHIPRDWHLALKEGRLLARAAVIPTLTADYDDAAALYRRCRRQGETVRRLIDCLIASAAIRAGAPILHNDADFDVLARHTELRTYEAEPG